MALLLGVMGVGTGPLVRACVLIVSLVGRAEVVGAVVVVVVVVGVGVGRVEVVGAGMGRWGGTRSSPSAVELHPPPNARSKFWSK